MKSQIQSKGNGGILELLITLNKIIRNQGTYFVVIMNNRLKIISVHGAPLYVWKDFFQKKLFMRGQKHFWLKKYWEVVLNWRTNDHIMSSFRRSFKNDNAFSSRPNLNIKYSLED